MMVLAEKPIGLTHETSSVALLEPRLKIAVRDAKKSILNLRRVTKF